ncbi:hypothetical protein ANRL1_02508 [Anaerolineae bacterium]|nr:hypothetical protein ANRL1_02508 [Anaerolineae bacterium]
MSELEIRRVRFSKEADNWLRVLKARTGITPNLLCRIGFCLSLSEPGIPSEDRYDDESDRDINRYTLLGEYDTVFVALLRQRLANDGIDPDAELEGPFRAHLHRGVILLASRMKHLSDLAEFVHRPPTLV